ncbi:MAG: SBBP repeat-containing protein [candidate division Zixibacteria bacterium]
MNVKKIGYLLLGISVMLVFVSATLSADATIESLINLPYLVSTYLGGNGNDGFGGIQLASDSHGNIYIVGYTNSSNFPPSLGNYQSPLRGGNDIYICKLNSGLTDVLAAAYIGGTGDDQYAGICINAQGEVIIAGYTGSSNFPITPGVVGGTYMGGSSDMFVAILDADLNTLIASTYLGGNQAEGPYNCPGLLTNTNGDIYVAGTTNSSDFPKTSNAYDTLYGGNTDYFITRLSSDLTSILSSTFVGGSGIEAFPSLVLDSENNIFIGGSTGSGDYPTTPNSYNRIHSGSYYNSAISKLDNSLSNLLASTLVGDAGVAELIIDDQGNLYNTGHTNHADYYTTPGAYDRTYNGYNDGFISKVDNDLENMVASTFLSGTTNSCCFMGTLVCDGNGNIYAFGLTESSNFPITIDAVQSIYGGGMHDAVIIKMDTDLSSISYASFIGGSLDDAGNEFIICDLSNSLIMAGHTVSTDFPTQSNVYSPNFNGGNYDAFIVKHYFNLNCGDANGDGDVNVGDAVYIISHVFKGGPAPNPIEAGDANWDGDCNVGDAVYLINHVFKGGPGPCEVEQ